MGGARCTYRNCTSRTDGVTHMFHYPVFDKMRCHKWLTNARRLDFLNLKVSQLRNRVVCQHHFRPDNFMNYKMDKLRYDAVPTENGPFCTVNEFLDKVKVMPIGVDEIENDQLTLREKKANFSVKYGDFLINSEMDPEKIELINQQTVAIEALKNSTQDVEIDFEDSNKHNLGNNKKIHIISEKKISNPVKFKGKLEPVPTNIIIGPRRTGSAQEAVENTENMGVVFSNQNENVDLTHSQITFYPQSITESQIVQLDQSAIVQLDQSAFSLPPVKPDLGPRSNLVEINILKPDITNNSEMLKAAPESNKLVLEVTPLKNKIISTQSNESSPKSLLKSKIPPERVAAIEKKRNFNKKLRDMIEFCLDDNSEKFVNENSNMKEMRNIENQIDTLKIIEEIKKPKELTLQHPEKHNYKNESSKQKGSTFLSEDANLPSVSDISFLEARITQMEKNLMRKIEQNTHRIVELKTTLKPPSLSLKKSVSNVMTQTKDDEDTLKKQLFNEISIFLSPDANSLIYEELFLNKFAKKPLQKSAEFSTPMKRRKLR